MENFIQDLIHKQAVSLPNSVALICGQERLTYFQLECQANWLADHLKSVNVRPADMVGVCMDRSLEMVVAVLGILKAGGVYVPLDPSYPEDRLAFILRDASVATVITTSRLQDTFSGKGIKTVCLDHEKAEIEWTSTNLDGRLVSPQDLAYVIYTSGSTGTPKGVMISHSSLRHFVRVAGLALDVKPEDIYLQSASIAYALSIRQLMLPLANGAAVVIATSEEVQDPLRLFQLIKNQNVTLMDVVPSFWRVCIQRLSDLPAEESKTLLDNSLRRIVCVGEPLHWNLPQDWVWRIGHKAKLVNIFGQTETTGVVATYPITDVPVQEGIVPIGRSVPDTKIYLLDQDLRQVPVGEKGELCISNPCLASGYLNHPEWTAEKFISNPFYDGLNARLYRTGDMARMGEDGNIEFLGRGDQQVKIRGQRLELGEVEAVVREHPLVKECVVAVRGDWPEDSYLAAYIIPADSQRFEFADLREFLRSRLPNYMIPAAFQVINSLPLTPNGKLDRRALPDPRLSISNPDFSRDPLMDPRDQLEKIIAQHWKELLKLDHVGIHDNFFDLGGHSLLVVRLFSRLEQEIGVRIHPAEILQAPTIASLAEHLKHCQTKTEDEVLIPFQTSGKGFPFFCVHGVGGGVIGYRDLAVALGENQPFYGLQAFGQDNLETCDTSIESMATRYIDAMRSLQPKGPYKIGGYCFGGLVAYEMACRLEKMGEQVSLLAIFEGFSPNVPKISVPFQQRLRLFWHTLPHWVQDYTNMSPEDLGHRASSTLFKLWAKLRKHPDLERRARVQEILETNLNRVPTRNIELTEIHSKAFQDYVPSPYGGRITLFRARIRSFNDVVFGSLDPCMGWGSLAKGGVVVKLVDGFHRNVHLPPHVNSLAAGLRSSLELEEQSYGSHQLGLVTSK